MTRACETYREDLAAEACGALPAEESHALARHLAECVTCRKDLDRLRAALTALDAYEVEVPPRLVEHTQRHVARQMPMRLPRPGHLSRPRVLRLAMAAAVMLGFVTAFVIVPALRQAPWTVERERTLAQLHGLYLAMDGYARAYEGWLPAAENWSEAVRPYLASTSDARPIVNYEALSDEYLFVQSLKNLFGGLGPGDVLFVARHKGPDNQFEAVTCAGRVELLSETRASRVFEIPRMAPEAP